MTCDSTSPNDMVTELEDCIENFGGEAQQVRCFLHVVNLVAKSIIRQFDVPKNLKKDVLDEAFNELSGLWDDLEDEEAATRRGLSTNDDEDKEQEDNTEGWIDERDHMTDEEIDQLKDDVWPLQLVLMKVCIPRQIPTFLCLIDFPRQLRKLVYALKNSTTIALPRWHQVLKDLELGQWIMPRDITTHWNSMFDMLTFALEYCDALVKIAGEKDLKLRKYEMDEDEWNLASQLCKVLEVM